MLLDHMVNPFREFTHVSTREPRTTATHDGLRPRLVARLTGLTQRQLRHLEHRGVLRPSMRGRGAGQGTVALYATSDVVQLIAIERVLSLCGPRVPVDCLKVIVAALPHGAPVGGGRLIIEPGGSWVEHGVAIESALRRTSVALILDLDAITDEASVRLRRAGVRCAEPSPPASSGPAAWLRSWRRRGAPGGRR